MITEGQIGGWRVALSVVIALTIAIFPVPHWLEVVRPEFLLLVVIYWSLKAPRIAGLTFGWLCGFAVDLIHGVVLGQHALAFLLIAAITHHRQLQMRVHPIWQQAFTVLIMLLIYEFIVFWIDGIIGMPVTTPLRWLPVITGALLWPVFVAVMDTWNRRRR